MLKISSSLSTAEVSESLVSGSRPVAEAGFTLTALTPTYANNTDTVTQAQSFVLLGGHTQTAFINMSTIAIFSLPQESWTYQTIDAPTGSSNTELAVKSTSSIGIPDSRSGHTAALTSDGSAIVVFGGWVGDIKTAADPQLVILRLGPGFGGAQDWAWEIPNTSGAGLAAGDGIYGHGAVMLPGDVMMVLGGNIIASTPSKVQRDASDAQAYFLNLTSMTWTSSYTNPSGTNAASSTSSSSSSTESSSNAKKIGLGAGLGAGLAAIIAAIGVYFWYRRRLRRKRNAVREKDLMGLGNGNADDSIAQGRGPNAWWTGPGTNNMTQRDGSGSWGFTGDNLGNRSMIRGISGYGPVANDSGYGGYDNAGSSVGGPEGHYQVPRKPLSSRVPGRYHQSNSNINTAYSGFDFGTGHTRSNSLGTAGAIHPIYEADEDLDVTDAKDASVRLVTDRGGHGSSPLVSPTEEFGDPFHDPLPSRMQPQNLSTGQRQMTPSPERQTAVEREREVASWVADWAAADAMLGSRSGRLSPSKESGRTISDLSEQSAAAASALSYTASTNTRNNSLKGIFSNGAGSWNPFATSSSAPNWNGMLGNGIHAYEPYRAGYGNGNISPTSDRSGRQPPLSSGSGTSSFTTAQTTQSQGNGQTTQTSSFTVLRAEGPTLLPRPQDLNREEGSPSKSKAAAFSRKKEGGWLGSLKRAFVGEEEWVSADGSTSTSDRSSPTRGHRSPSFSGSASPTRTGYMAEDSRVPRRTVSASSTMLWRRKQGRDDWQDSAEGSALMPDQRSNTLTSAIPSAHDGDAPSRETTSGPNPPRADDEEWDIEKAVRSRVVQVMFTVPKDKLRVVNAGPADHDDDKSDAASLVDRARDWDQAREMGKGEEKGKEREGDAELRDDGVNGIMVPDLLHLAAELSLSRSSSPERKRGRVLEMVDRMEKERT
ncbi:MAG: hypothetical protein M1818_000472 [Claussenomyces sp. TS43310]|nr:MAG: hypothetical protein M1818_000472 [Claussenomyces sp. TS43310]